MAEYKTLGILTGISVQSGIDYYKNINEKFTASVPKQHVIKPNPNIVMVSVDCDQYCLHLEAEDWAATTEYLITKGVDKIVAAGCDVMCLASNTAHIIYNSLRAKYPQIEVIHIADCTAAALKQQGIERVGLLGTKPTMTQSYLTDRLAAHGIECLVPDSTEALDRIFSVIKHELTFGVFNDSSRNFYLEQIAKLVERGAQGVILGCTEIELLVQQKHCPDVPLFPTAELHIATIAAVLAGNVDTNTLVPKPGESLSDKAKAKRAAEEAAAVEEEARKNAEKEAVNKKAVSPSRSAYGSSFGGGKSSISFGGYGQQDASKFVSSNRYASGSNQNSGNVITNRPSTRVRNAPGGSSSIVFGSSEPLPGSKKRGMRMSASSNKSSIAFGESTPASAPARNPASAFLSKHNKSTLTFGNTNASHNDSTKILSSNRYANGAHQNTGNVITGRSSTRVHAPPGGQTTISFGMTQAESDRAEANAAAVGVGTASVDMPVAGAQSSTKTESNRSSTQTSRRQMESSISLGFPEQVNPAKAASDSVSKHAVEVPEAAPPTSAKRQGNQATISRGWGGENAAQPSAPVSSNNFASGASQNTGNVMTGRSSTRIHNPPGGKSSFIFG